MNDPDSADPTVREPTVRLRRGDESLVSAADESAGGIDFDELGRARWKWATEGDRAGADIEDTFDYLKALDRAGLEIAENGEADSVAGPEPGEGYNPYDTVVLPAPPKPRTR